MKHIEYFFLPTKQCNLRCLYCNEKENYKNKQILTPSIIRKIFLKILFFYKSNKLEPNIKLSYTGGEILTLGKKWMRDILGLQREIFGAAKFKYTTTIQTNLTLLDQEWIEILKENKVGIGASLDLFAKTRPFKGTKNDSASVVVDKLIMLVENKLGAGIIVVITRQNYKKGKEIFKVMNKIGLPFHTVPLDQVSMKYCPDLAISPEEYAECLIEMMEEYLKPNRRIGVQSLDGYISLVKHGYPPKQGMCFNMRNCWDLGNMIFFENTGETYYCCTFRKPEILLGNVFTDSIAKMFSRLYDKKVFKKLYNRYEFIKAECAGCEFLSICSGGCPAFAYEDGNMFSRSKFYCAVNKKLFSYLKNKLKRAPKHLQALK